MQLPRPTCKSCGNPLDGRASRQIPAPPAAPRPISPPSPRAGPIYKTDKAPPFLAEEIPASAAQEFPPLLGDDTDRTHGFFFYGTGGALFGIQIVNILLTILTLGIYYFWGKVRVRSYLLSQTEFAGDRFAYHGTGKELLMGFLKAVLLFWVPILGLLVGTEILEASPVVKAAAKGLAYILLFVFIPVAMVGARRYRLSRTSWRGIRFSFRGRVIDFIKLFIGGSLLTGITLGLYYPFFDTRRYAFMASHSYFGSQRFHFDGRGRDLFGSYLLALLLTLPTLGLYWFWFQAKKHRYFWEQTSLGQARFRSTVTGGRLLLLGLGNLLLLILTLGLGWPWVLVRNVRFAFQYLTLQGSLDPAAIKQQAQVASATGEGLASFLDLDTGFDFG
jgi:uncharacterized membrane protein YjgN (DUF898 family)